MLQLPSPVEGRGREGGRGRERGREREREREGEREGETNRGLEVKKMKGYTKSVKCPFKGIKVTPV